MSFKNLFGLLDTNLVKHTQQMHSNQIQQNNSQIPKINVLVPKPVQPVPLVQPAQPTQPTQPAQPAQPTQPAQPAQPAQPIHTMTQPVQPGSVVTQAGGARKKKKTNNALPANKKKSGDTVSNKKGVLEKRTVDKLAERAKQLKIKGRSQMTKSELIQAIRKKNNK